MDRTHETLMNRLQPEEFRIVMLLTTGVNHTDLAVYLHTSTDIVDRFLHAIHTKSQCLTRKELVMTFITEYQLGMYDDRIMEHHKRLIRERALQIGMVGTFKNNTAA
jgi:hypothetical protein